MEETRACFQISRKHCTLAFPLVSDFGYASEMTPISFPKRVEMTKFVSGILEADLEQVVEVMGLKSAVKFTNDIGAADAILALHSDLKENSWIRGVAKYQRLPIFVMKTNMMAEMVRAMRTILGLETLGASSLYSFKKSKNDIEISDGAAKKRTSREEIDALEEARLAIEYIVIPGRQPVELLPRCADIIARQIKLVESYQLVTEKSGTELDSRLQILPLLADKKEMDYQI